MSIRAVVKTEAVSAQDVNTVDLNQFYSVEFSVDNIKFLYQFKLWRSPTAPMFVLVKRESEMLDKLKSGDILNMKYYSTDTRCPTCHLDTRILDIRWNDRGKFKGHYAVNLGFIDHHPSPPLRRATHSM